MNDQPPNQLSGSVASGIRAEPGVPVIRNVNWPGTWALYMKEVRRFMKVQLQTVWSPAITTLLFLVIFSLALGRQSKDVMGVPFADFIAPGLIVSTGMLQASFANSSFSFLSGKMNGTLVDYLMPPISTGELLGALVGAAVTRACMVGATVWLGMALWPGVHVTPIHFWAIAWFGLLGSALLAFIGVLTSIWADKFDHAAAITNFVISPLTLLSGTFYAIDKVSPLFYALSHLNPFFYIISGFRYGFLSVSDTDVLLGSVVILALNIVLGGACYMALSRGWKLKA